jgi:hypothetical protein
VSGAIDEVQKLVALIPLVTSEITKEPIFNSFQGSRDLLATLNKEQMKRETGEKEIRERERERERDSCLILHFILQLSTRTVIYYIYKQF